MIDDTPNDPSSLLLPGVSRRSVAAHMGMTVAEIEAIELKFRLRLREKLAADPETAHLLTLLPKPQKPCQSILP